MKRILLIILIQLIVAFALLIPSLTAEWMMAQAQNITLPQNTNDTRLIVSMKNHTLTFVNRTTNETIKVENFTMGEGNKTTNETLPGSVGNMTTNETLPGSVGNMTTNDSLTDKFRQLGN
jgi:hypothetical protein